MQKKASLGVFVFCIMHTLSGCIVLPIPKYTSTKSCAKVFEEFYAYTDDLNFMTPGSTTKNVVIQNLGNPDVIKVQENSLGYYQWTEKIGDLNWYVGIFGGYSGEVFMPGSTPMRRACLLLVEFGNDDVLERYMVRGIWPGSLNDDTEWIRVKELPKNYNEKPHVRIKPKPPTPHPTVKVSTP